MVLPHHLVELLRPQLVGQRTRRILVEAGGGEQIGKTRDLERATSKPSRSWQIVIRRGGQQISAVING